jgi:NRAMP (natural resistance-associated macrophage protein)-like metal ion transporter
VDQNSPGTETLQATEAGTPATLSAQSTWHRLPEYLKALGPGLIAGLADNDPSGVASYAIAGSIAGYRFLWLLLVATFMVQAIQVSAARLGEVTEQGFLGVVRRRYGSTFAAVAGLAILAANQTTLIADVAAVGAALQLLTGLAWRWFVLPAALLLLVGVVISDFRALRNVFVVVGLLLLAYVVTAFLAHPRWDQAIEGTFVPSLPRSSIELAAAVALLGTTVSPYLVVWQTQGEREAQRTQRHLPLAVVDVTAGYVMSNLLSYFIVVTTAATLYARHQSIATAADAAQALRPLAGDQASAIFAFGLLAAGCLAIPVFAIANGFVVSELLDWPAGLSKSFREAPSFYGVLAVALVAGGVAALLGVDPIVALFDSQILTGLLMVPIILVLGLLVNDRSVMGGGHSTSYYNIWLTLSFVVMAGAAGLLVLNLI